MNKLILAGVVFLVGCSSEYIPAAQQLPPVDASLMVAPCKLSAPSANADDDLAIDVANAECARQLRLKVYRLQDWVRNVTTEW